MQRFIEFDLQAWKARPNHLPLLLRGARQVGKTEAVRRFGEKNYTSFVEINLEDQPELAECFNSFDPQTILNLVKALTGQAVKPGETLFFIDEIQEVPRAIQALRYFKEKMPALDVIGAGSLLEFALNAEAFKMPVGRVEYLYLYPLSFEEYLLAMGYEALLEAINHATLSQPLPTALHKKALQLVREYMVVGGMPAVVADYQQQRDIDVVQRLQTNLWATYKGDFGKYAKKVELPALHALFDKLPSIIGQSVKYSKIDEHFRSTQLKQAIELLSQAGLVHRAYASSASHVPINALYNYKKYKLFCLDMGLICARAQLSGQVMLQGDLTLVHQGALSEQWVAQALLANDEAYRAAELAYWQREKRGAQAEVDFVLQRQDKIVPIEVKSGKTGRLKSLHVFIQEKGCPFGVQVSQAPLAQYDNILSVPFYMLHRLFEEGFLALGEPE